MDTENDPKFWEWLKEKVRREQVQEYEQLPLFIRIEKPQRESALIEEETPIDYEIDYSIDYNV